MRTPEEIKETIDDYSNNLKGCAYYEPLMLEIMCNIAITLAKIVEQYKGDKQ